MKDVNKLSQAERVSKYIGRKLKEELYSEGGGYLTAHELEDGDLLICMGRQGRKELRRDIPHRSNYYESVHEIIDCMLCNSAFELLSAEEISALSACYLVLGYDLRWSDELGAHQIEEGDRVWWHGDYQIKLETEELANRGYIVLNRA